jgi:transposase
VLRVCGLPFDGEGDRHVIHPLFAGSRRRQRLDAIPGAPEEKSARQFHHFLRQLLDANRKRFVVLVLDNASYHSTARVLDLLTEHEDHVFVVWLPIYSPDLNAIEGLWGYLKKTTLNNYFFGDTQRLEDAIDRAFHELNRHPQTALSLAYTIKNLRRIA